MAVKTKRAADKVLMSAKGNKRFFCQDGQISKNLPELMNCLNRMTEDAFHHHVTSEKNDFSNWIRDVLGDSSLASDMKRASSTAEASRILAEKIKRLQKKLA
jgi:hypothetical protein